MIFVFSWMLMLLTTITFIIGAPLKGFICEPLTDPSYEIFHEVHTHDIISSTLEAGPIIENIFKYETFRS